MTHGALVETFAGNSGGVTFSGPWTLPSTGTTTIANYGTSANTITVSGGIGGAAALTINTATANYNRAWTFTGANTFSGALTITAGTLTLGGAGDLGDNGGGSGSYAANIANGGTFTYSSSASQTLSGIISGTGALSQSAGTLILSGANTYTGTTTLSGGTLQLAAAEAAGSSGPLGQQLATAAGTIVLSGGTLQFSSANQNDYSGRFSTAVNQACNIDVNGQAVTLATPLTSPGGTLTLSDTAGGGTLTLPAVNTYTGVTTVNSGTLNLTGSIAGNVTSAGTLNVSGSVAGNVTVTAGAVNVTGAIAGNATVNGGTLAGSVANSIGGNVTVNAGTLELDSATAMSSGATLSLASSLGSGGTAYLNFTGTQNISALSFGGVPQSPGIYGSGTSSAPPGNQYPCFTGNGVLNVGSGNASSWDANGTLANSTGTGGGTGNWDNATPDWWVSGSSDVAWSAGNVANFAGTAGTVTVADNVTAESLTFTTPGYTLSGSSTLTLWGTAPTISVPAGAPTAIGCPIAGPSPVTVSGPGKLVLSRGQHLYGRHDGDQRRHAERDYGRRHRGQRHRQLRPLDLGVQLALQHALLHRCRHRHHGAQCHDARQHPHLLH